MAHHIDPRSVTSYLSGICNTLEPYYPTVRSVRNSALVYEKVARQQLLPIRTFTNFCRVLTLATLTMCFSFQCCSQASTRCCGLDRTLGQILRAGGLH